MSRDPKEFPVTALECMISFPQLGSRALTWIIELAHVSLSRTCTHTYMSP